MIGAIVAVVIIGLIGLVAIVAINLQVFRDQGEDDYWRSRAAPGMKARIAEAGKAAHYLRLTGLGCFLPGQ